MRKIKHRMAINMSKNININEITLPALVRITNVLFLFLSSSLMIFFISLISILGTYIVDSHCEKVVFFPKGGSFIAIFGLLLTIRYRFVKSLNDFKSCYDSCFGSGGFSTTHVSKEEISIVNSISTKECVGFWLIILGTVISLTGEYVPLIDMYKLIKQLTMH
jgi:hypothetical protein